MEITQYIAKHYFKDDTPARAASVERILNVPGVRMFGTPAQGFVALYIEVSDFGVSMLKNMRAEEGLTMPFMLTLLQHTGDNVLVFLCVADGVLNMRRMYRAFVYSHRPHSLMWVDPKHMFLHEYKVRTWATV